LTSWLFESRVAININQGLKYAYIDECTHMPRITLYVSADLKTRMDEVGAAESWSGIAQKAFSEAITLRRLRKDPTDMKEVVERLRASKQRSEDRDENHGQGAGAEWARVEAEFDELKRIADHAERGGDRSLDTLRALIDPEREMDRSQWAEFWERHGGWNELMTPSDAFADGFIEGAADVYAQVADQL
jgi:hypothetical protein